MIEYVKLKMQFKVEYPCYLPAYPGSTFRGLFKTALRRTSCQNGIRQCSYCIWRPDCAYALITEYTTDTGENTVQPYAISCASTRSGFFDNGEIISLNMLFVGNAIQYIPTILKSCEGWQELDMAFYKFFVSDAKIQQLKGVEKWADQIKPAGKLLLHSVIQVVRTGQQKIIYDSKKICGSPIIENLSFYDTSENKTWRLKIRLLSPMRLFRRQRGQSKGSGKKQLIRPETFNFEIFIRAILTRYCGFQNHFGYPDDSLESGNMITDRAIESAKSAILLKNDLFIEKIRRYKRDMTQWEHLDGLMGEVIFDNVHGSLISWVMIGELLQVGKFPTQGYGEYVAEYELIS